MSTIHESSNVSNSDASDQAIGSSMLSSTSSLTPSSVSKQPSKCFRQPSEVLSVQGATSQETKEYMQLVPVDDSVNYCSNDNNFIVNDKPVNITFDDIESHTNPKVQPQDFHSLLEDQNDTYQEITGVEPSDVHVVGHQNWLHVTTQSSGRAGSQYWNLPSKLDNR